MSRVTDIPHRVYTGGVQVGGGEACRGSRSGGSGEAAGYADVEHPQLDEAGGRSRLTGEGNRRQPVSEAQAEIARLRREVASLKVDNEILRKAAAYFAKGSR
jgi:hypothetical protein